MGLETLGNIFSFYYFRNLVDKMRASNMDFLCAYHFFFVRGVTLIREMGCVECQIIMKPPGSNKLHLL